MTRFTLIILADYYENLNLLKKAQRLKTRNCTNISSDHSYINNGNGYVTGYTDEIDYGFIDASGNGWFCGYYDNITKTGNGTWRYAQPTNTC